jgi:hypothetical protein
MCRARHSTKTSLNSLADFGKYIFFTSKMSRLALGPTQYPIQWLMGVLSLKVGQQGMKLTTHIHLVPKSRIGGDKSHLPYMPSKHALGITIPFTFHPEQATVTQC